MKTMAQESRAKQAEYKTDIARLGERIEGLLGTDAARRDAAAARRDAAAAQREITYKTDIARLGERIEGLGTEAAKRETRLVLTVAVMLGLAVAILGYIN